MIDKAVYRTAPATPGLLNIITFMYHEEVNIFQEEIRVLAYFMCFLVRALPEVRDQIRNQFSDKVLYN